MINQEILKILVCPQDQAPLRLADEELLARVNGAISAGQIENQGGEPVRQLLEAALVRRDDALLYPITDDIPVLLSDEAIRLDQITS